MSVSVTIDKKSGFCFGVVFAVKMAEEILEKEDYLYCLGHIVHNDEEVRRLEAKGLRIIDHTQLAKLQNERVLIRAHGEPPNTYKIAYENNIELLDASCPVVLKLQHSVKQTYTNKEQIYIYGKLDHPEVQALLPQTQGEAVVFQSLNELDLDTLPKQLTLYSQTTKAISDFYAIIRAMQEAGIDVRVRDTICRQVSNRERDLQEFALQYDKVVFVSGTRSSNGKVLYKTCKRVNPKTYFVSSAADLQPEWFSEDDKIGICGATSTPQWLMKDVRRCILSLPCG